MISDQLPSNAPDPANRRRTSLQAAVVLVNVDALMDPVFAMSHGCEGRMSETASAGLGFWHWFRPDDGDAMGSFFGVQYATGGPAGRDVRQLDGRGVGLAEHDVALAGLLHAAGIRETGADDHVADPVAVDVARPRDAPTREVGVIDPQDIDLFIYAETAGEAWKCIRDYWEEHD